MSDKIISLVNARRARERAPLLEQTDRQKYAAALRRQKPREPWQVELDAAIGPEGEHDFTPPGAA